MLEQTSVGVEPDVAAQAIVPQIWPTRQTPDAVTRFAKAKLRQPDICRMLEAGIEEKTGFTLGDHFDMLVKHIKGDVTKQVVTRDGAVVELKVQPNFAALMRYSEMVLPKPKQEISVQTQSVTAHVVASAGDLDSKPEYAIRKLQSVSAGAQREDDPDE